jgi:thiamine kinase-like enzyme
MKTILLLTLLFCASCQKETINDFSINRDILIHRVTCPANDTSKHNIQFDLKSLTNDQIQAHMIRNRFKRWIMPNDTIWLLNEFVKGFGEKQRLYRVYPDSAYVISREDAKMSTCIYHVGLIHTDSLNILHKIVK